MLATLKYYLTPASYEVRRRINVALKEITLEMTCVHCGLFSRSGIFKNVAWSVVGQKDINGVTAVEVACSDKDIQSAYNLSR